MPATWPSLKRWELLLCSFLPIICHFSFYVLLYLSYEKFGIVNRGRRHIKHYLAKANICVFFNVALTCIKRFETVPGSGDHDMVFPENITKRSVFQNRRNPHNSELSGRKQWYYWYYFFFFLFYFLKSELMCSSSYCPWGGWISQGHPLDLNKTVSRASTFFSLQSLLTEISYAMTSQYENCRGLNKDIWDENTKAFWLGFLC